MPQTVRQPRQLSSRRAARAPLDRQPATPYRLCWCRTWPPPWPPCQWRLCRSPGGAAAGGQATTRCGLRGRSHAASQCSECQRRPCRANVSSQGLLRSAVTAELCCGMPYAVHCGADACAGRRLCCPALKLLWLPLLALLVQPQLPHALQPKQPPTPSAACLPPLQAAHPCTQLKWRPRRLKTMLASRTRAARQQQQPQPTLLAAPALHRLLLRCIRKWSIAAPRLHRLSRQLQSALCFLRSLPGCPVILGCVPFN